MRSSEPRRCIITLLFILRFGGMPCYQSQLSTVPLLHQVCIPPVTLLRNNLLLVFLGAYRYACAMYSRLLQCILLAKPVFSAGDDALR